MINKSNSMKTRRNLKQKMIKEEEGKRGLHPKESTKQNTDSFVVTPPGKHIGFYTECVEWVHSQLRLKNTLTASLQKGKTPPHLHDIKQSDGKASTLEILGM